MKYFLLKLLFYTFSLLPWWIMYLISDGFFVFLFHVVKYRRKIVRENIALSFPEKNFKQVQQIEKSFYKNLCDWIVETIKGISCSKKVLMKRFVYKNYPIISNSKKVVCLSCHKFNWEWQFIYPLVAHDHDKIGTFYHPLKSSLWNRLFNALRSRFGVYQLSTSSGIKQIIQWNNDNEKWTAYALADQSPTSEAGWYWTTFLNRKTCFMTGMEKIIKYTNCDVYFVDQVKIKRGYYEATIYHLKYDTNQNFSVIESFVRQCEKAIREQPETYLWSHNRWKHKQEK